MIPSYSAASLHHQREPLQGRQKSGRLATLELGKRTLHAEPLVEVTCTANETIQANQLSEQQPDDVIGPARPHCGRGRGSRTQSRDQVQQRVL